MINNSVAFFPGSPLNKLLSADILESGTCKSPLGMCVLSRFSGIRLFASLWTVARQAPQSMGILQARILEWVAMPPSTIGDNSSQ